MSEIEWERRLQKRLAYDREILGKEDGVMAYGYCPRCGSRGKLRERRPDGNDVCEAGHVYPSREATGRPRADALEAMRAEVERLTRERDELKAKNEHLDAMVSVLLTPGGQTKVLSALMAEAARRANERLDAKGAPDAPA